MNKTIVTGCDVREKWLWYDVMHDLNKALYGREITAKDVKGVTIDPLSVSEHGCGGNLEGNKFYMTWVKDKFLLVSMQKYSTELVAAFSKVVGYEPFCKYVSEVSGLLTVEWDKMDPKGRYEVLKKDSKVTGLEQL